MPNLFIVGNGFDLSHRLPTSYQDFHRFLIREYPDAIPDDITLAPWSDTMPDGSEEYDVNEVVGTIMKLINDVEGDNWSNLEHSIGYLEYDDFFEYVDLSDDDTNEWHTVYNNEDTASNLSGAVAMITDYFANWVTTININNSVFNMDFTKIINANVDYFLTFNYTLTLEELYGVQNICHIHGKQGEKLYFGHGNDSDYYDNYLGGCIGSENAMGNLQQRLRKNTKEAFDNNIDFFINLREINNIYSFGFSFSDVDLFYITEICKQIDTKHVIWMLNDYESKSIRDSYMKKIKECGFQGSFGTYHIS